MEALEMPTAGKGQSGWKPRVDQMTSEGVSSSGWERWAGPLQGLGFQLRSQDFNL